MHQFDLEMRLDNQLALIGCFQVDYCKCHCEH